MEPDRTGRTFVCVGTSHRVAPVPFLEQAMRGAESLRRSAESAFARGDTRSHPFTELVVLSTCNRVELYVSCSEAATPASGDVLAAALRGTAGDEPDAIYRREGEAAIRHLCRVAAGLDSLVVGEPQIAGQVARAFDTALRVNGGRSLAAAAARAAKTAGRRARTETAIARRPASISSVAVHFAAELLGGLGGRHVLVVGAGKIGRLACEALRASGAAITVANRTLRRAESLAARVAAQAAPLSSLPDLLAASDVVITSTASPLPIIGVAEVRRALDRREARRGAAGEGPVLFIDIAIPRNVAPDVASLPGTRVLGLDDLRGRIAAHLAERRDEIPRVEQIIDEEVASFARGRESVQRVIGRLHRRAEQIRRREIERTLRGLDPVDPALRERMDRLSRSLVNKLLHEPASRLRAASERGPEYARVVQELFALDDAAERRP